MISAVRALLEQRHADGLPRLRVPMAGGTRNAPLEGAALLRQMADYSWEDQPPEDRSRRDPNPRKVNDDYVDALKLAVWGLRGGGAGPVAGPPGPRWVHPGTDPSRRHGRHGAEGDAPGGAPRGRGRRRRLDDPVGAGRGDARREP